MPGVQVRGDVAHGRPHGAEVGPAVVAPAASGTQITATSAVGEASTGRWSARNPALDHLGDVGVGEVVDVRAPGVEPVDDGARSMSSPPTVSPAPVASWASGRPT